jgi:hypothetical protein
LKVRHGRSGEGYSTAEAPRTPRKSAEKQDLETVLLASWRKLELQRSEPTSSSFAICRFSLIFPGALGVSVVNGKAENWRKIRRRRAFPEWGLRLLTGVLKEDGDNRLLAKFVNRDL